MVERKEPRNFNAVSEQREYTENRGHFVPGKKAGPKVSTVTPGQPCHLVSNHFKVGLKEAKGFIYIYSVDFGGYGDQLHERLNCMRQIRKDLYQVVGIHLFYDTQMYATQKIQDDLQFAAATDQGVANLTIKLIDKFSLDEQSPEQRKNIPKIMNFCASIIKKTLYEKDYKQVGRLPRFFNAKEQVPIEKHDLLMWPGYDCQTKSLNDGIFLNIDTATKFLSSFNMLECIDYEMKANRFTNEEMTNYYCPKDPDEKRLVVITMYNSRAYQVDGIDWSLNPSTYKFNFKYKDQKSEEMISTKDSMVKYLLLKHNIKMTPTELNQPLLTVKIRDQILYLPPSRCFQASLPKDFTSNSNKMKDLQDYKQNNPGQRFDRIASLIKIFQDTKLLSEWDMKININFAEVKGKQLYHPKILDSKNFQQDFSAYERREVKHSQPLQLKNGKWSLVYSAYDFNSANNLYQMMGQAGKVYGIGVEEPQWIEIPSQNSADYNNEIVAKIKRKTTQIVVVLIQKKESKAVIKQQLDLGGLPSQFLLTGTVDKAHKNNQIGVFSNILKQMNAKVRQDLYRLSLPHLKTTMVVGVYVINEGSKRLVGCSASSNAFLSQYYTRVYPQENPKGEAKLMSKDEQEKITTEGRREIITQFFAEALKNYQECNKGNLPDQIIFYRDGCGGPTLMQKIQDIEVEYVVEYLEGYAKNYKPQLIYCLVNRNISHRLFSKNGTEKWNPGPGTVLDNALVESQGDRLYDFFLIPHRATVATAQPVHYKIVYNTSKLNKDQMETSTYHLCYNYFNFQGSIKVPSACMYAHKIALYSHDNRFLSKICTYGTNTKLSNNLHFL